MYNSEKSKSGYDVEYADFEPEMTSARNARARSEHVEERKETRPTREFGSSASFERLIDEKPERNIEDDLVPSGTTMQFVGRDRKYVYEDMNDLDEKKESVTAKEGLSGKSKIMIAVYAIVVLTVFTLIIMNTKLLKSMETSINEQEAHISELVQENDSLSRRYEFVSSDEEVIRRAEEMGMVKND